MTTDTQKHRIPAWLTALWRQSKPSEPIPAPPPEQRPIGFMAELLKTASELQGQHEEQLKLAQSEAASGTGPQPWDRDWIENSCELGDDLEEMISGWGWHAVNDLIEVLDWALASPQGQRAQALAEDSAQRENEPLQLIYEMRPVLVSRVHRVLREQGRRLGYSDQWRANLDDALS